MEPRTCIKCGHTLFESGRFCPQCGAPQSKKCPSCKADNSTEALFCSHCGSAFGKPARKKPARPSGQVRPPGTGPRIWIGAAVGIILIAAASWYAAFSERPAPPSGGAPTAIDPNMQATLGRLQEQLKQNPENVGTWIQLGNLYYDTGNFEESIFHYQHALLMDSTDNNVRVDMAIGYYNTGRPERAVEEMKTVLENDPNHLNGLFNIGVVLNSMGDREAARTYWEKYLSLRPAGELSDRIRTMMQEWN